MPTLTTVVDKIQKEYPWFTFPGWKEGTITVSEQLPRKSGTVKTITCLLNNPSQEVINYWQSIGEVVVNDIK